MVKEDLRVLKEARANILRGEVKPCLGNCHEPLYGNMSTPSGRWVMTSFVPRKGYVKYSPDLLTSWRFRMG